MITKQQILDRLRPHLLTIDTSNATLTGRAAAMAALFDLADQIEKDIEEQQLRFLINPPRLTIEDTEDKLSEVFSVLFPPGKDWPMERRLRFAFSYLTDQAKRHRQEVEQLKEKLDQINLEDRQTGLESWKNACRMIDEALCGPLHDLPLQGNDVIADGIPALIAEVKRLRAASETKAPIIPAENKSGLAEESLRPLAEMLLSLGSGRAKEASIHKVYEDFQLTYTVKVGAVWE